MQSIKEHFREWIYKMSKDNAGDKDRPWYILFMIAFILAPLVAIPVSIIAFVVELSGSFALIAKVAWLFALVLDLCLWVITKPKY